MSILKNNSPALILSSACALALSSGSHALAAPDSTVSTAATTNAEMTEDRADATRQVHEARQIITKMQRDADLAAALNTAEGVFVATDYGRAALGIGVRGGEGVLLTRQNGEWENPVFYNFGGLSAGLQAGVEGGSLAFVLTNRRALDSFAQKNNWSLNADAGLTVVDWSARAQANAGKGDVIAWSDAKGLMGDLALSVTDIRFDEEETLAYYGNQVTRVDIIYSTTVVSPRVAEVDDE